VKFLAALGAAFVLASCSVSNHNVFNDHRLHFVAPASRAHVGLPVTLRWTMRGFTPVDPGTGPPSRTQGYFAVFVDRPPVGPGQKLDVVADRDTSCKRTPGCPDTSYLADRQIYTTAGSTLVLNRVADFVDNRQKQQLHEATIVLLDSAGRRIGESFWYLDFWLPRAGAV